VSATALPAGFASIRVFFPDNPVYGIPLLVTVCSPGGSYSNWWCSLFNSDLPLSMAMTTASSLFAVATLPINILIYLKLAYPKRDGSVSLDWGGLFTSLAIVVVGIFGGLVLGNKVPRWRGLLGKLGNTSGVCLVLLGFFFSSNSSAPIWARDRDFYVGVGLPCLFGLAISLAFSFMCGLPKPQCLSVTIETCYQNTAIPLAVILSSFSNDDVALCESLGVYAGGSYGGGGSDGGDKGGGGKRSAACDVVGIAAGVPTFYQVVQILALGVVCIAGWKAGWTYAPPEHAMWKVLARNYQPGTADEEDEADENRRLARGGSFGVGSFGPDSRGGLRTRSRRGLGTALEEAGAGVQLNRVVTERNGEGESALGVGGGVGEGGGGGESPVTPKDVEAARARGVMQDGGLMGGANVTPSPPEDLKSHHLRGPSADMSPARDNGGGSGRSGGGGGGAAAAAEGDADAEEYEEARDEMGSPMPRTSRVSVSSIDLEANNAHVESYPLPPTPLKKINQPKR
jgi:hypothetical protein